MMKKRLSKTLWYGTDVDTSGKPIVPPFTDDPSDLNGLHIGEPFIHYANGKPTLWTANENGNVVSIVGGDSVDLSGYLLKEVFDKLWSLQVDSNGNEYILGKLPLAIAGGVTMYADSDNLDIPSIYAGLPIDGRTIVRDENGVLMINPGIDLGGGLDEVELTEFLTTNGYAKKSDIPSLSGYATQSWVEGKGYALSSDLNAISAKLNNFLEGSDTDTIINKWLELETFLSGLSESDNLATILAGKIDKTYVDSNFVTINTAQSILEEKDFTGGLKVNGAPIVYNSEKGYWKLEGDLLVTGGVSFYSSDTEYVPSTIMSALLLDDSTLGINSEGQLYVKGNLSGGASTLGELSNVGTWANSVADVDRIMYQAAGSSLWVAKSLSDLAVGGVSGDYLPLSGGTMISGAGIYNPNDTGVQGAIGFNKTENCFGSITFPTVLRSSTQILARINDVDTYILHSGNYSNYALPLTGGTLSGALTISSSSWGNQLTIHRSQANADALIGFSNEGDGIIGYIGIGGSVSTVAKLQPYFSTGSSAYPILHSGNYSSYALPLSGGTINGNITISNSIGGLSLDNPSYGFAFLIYKGGSNWQVTNENGSTGYTLWHSGNDGSGSGLDADLLDGYNVSNMMLVTNDASFNLNSAPSLPSNSFVMRLGGSNANLPSNAAYGNLLRVSGTYSDTAFDLLGCYSPQKLYFRSGSGNYDSVVLGSTWKEVAFTDSNVASATKLQTARTIWGQSFDGTGNITYNKVPSIQYASFVGRDGSTEAGYVGRGADHEDNIYLCGYTGNSVRIGANGAYNHLVVNTAGNVGIGTTSPSAKLHVQGVVFSFAYQAIGNNCAAFVFDKVGGHRTGIGANGVADTIYFGAVSATDNYSWVSYTQTWQFGGNIIANGGITMYSDQRKKTILNNVELSLKQIADAPLVEHFYNSDDKRTTHVGSIAQYWADINDWFCKLDNEGYYTMEIQNCALASAISIARELSRYESKTDKKIKQLKKRICQLEEEIERLKSA